MSAARHPSRRAVLIAGALLPVAACTGGGDHQPEPAPVDPDVALREGAAARERTLLTHYDVTMLAESGQAARLAPLRAEHAAHLVALGFPVPAGSSGVTGPPTVGSPAPAPPPATLSTAPSRLQLAQAERDTAAAHTRDALAASRALAGVLASLAASEASHPVALA